MKQIEIFYFYCFSGVSHYDYQEKINSWLKGHQNIIDMKMSECESTSTIVFLYDDKEDK